MIDNIVASFLGLGAFCTYFGISIALLLVFAVIYTWITPYRELSLIRAGNTAAACSLSGSLLGFTIPLASAVTHSINLPDMIVWGVVALVVQVLTFLAVRIVFPLIVQDIPDNQTAKGIFLGAASLVVGIVNAACMTY